MDRCNEFETSATYVNYVHMDFMTRTTPEDQIVVNGSRNRERISSRLKITDILFFNYSYIKYMLQYKSGFVLDGQRIVIADRIRNLG